jgi:hypothetical protein
MRAAAAESHRLGTAVATERLCAEVQAEGNLATLSDLVTAERERHRRSRSSGLSILTQLCALEVPLPAFFD